MVTRENDFHQLSSGEELNTIASQLVYEFCDNAVHIKENSTSYYCASACQGKGASRACG